MIGSTDSFESQSRSLDNDAVIFRAIRSKGWVNSDTGSIDSQAFLLRSKTEFREREESLSANFTVEQSAAWGSKCYGVIEIRVGDIREAGFDIVVDSDKHISIVGLPHTEDDEKAALDAATKLSKKAKICLDKLNNPIQNTPKSTKRPDRAR